MSKGGGVDNSGQNEAAKQMADIAGQMWDQYKTTYLPVEQQYVADAQNYDTPERREQYAGRANADVQQAFDDQRAQQGRQLEQYGISPDSGKFASVNSRLRLQQAATAAGAQNQARLGVEQMGWNRRTDALSLGKGLPAQASAGYSGAASAFGSAAGLQQKQNQMDNESIANGVSGTMVALGKNGANVLPSFGSGLRDGGLIDTKKMRHYAGGGPVMGGPQQILGMAQQATQTAAPSQSAHGVPMSTYAQLGKMGRGIYNTFKPGAQYTSPAEMDSALAGDQVAAGAGAEAGTDMLTGEALAAAAPPIAETAAAAATPELADAALLLLALKDGGRVNGIHGGAIHGPGSETSDSIPAMLSDGEYVINAEAVKHFGVDKLNKMNEVGLKTRYGIKK